MQFNIGDLVEDSSEQYFRGTGKLESINEIEGVGLVGFYTSPQKPSDRQVLVKLNLLGLVTLYDEQNIYYFYQSYKIWRRARYGGSRPSGNHLIIFTKDDEGHFDDAVVPIHEIYILNLDRADFLDPAAFLKNRYVDPPFFYNVRHEFLQSYIAQRSACRSISAIPSSSIELESHQLAVVRRVLQDNTKKYLLADEVGLGKTIEAGIILKELLFKDSIRQTALIGVPTALIGQWKDELTNRFHLGDLIDQSLFICSHDSLADILKEIPVDILIIDEAHQIAPWAWSSDDIVTTRYKFIATASHKTEACLLLSGTPLNGNERNFLAMLHLIAPESYEISEVGLKEFSTKVAQREQLGGIYQSLTDSNDNGTLTDLIEQIIQLFGGDEEFLNLAGQALPYLDWSADSEGPERTDIIVKLRRYVGEHYRLHQRLLRNRRTDPGVSILFPGLAAVEFKYWPYDGVMSTEQILDSHRAAYFNQGHEYLALKPDNYLDWIEDAFISPHQIACRSETALLDVGGDLCIEEKNVLEDLVVSAKQEQKAKDSLLRELLNSWLIEHATGKAIVFCSNPDIADQVADYLDKNITFVTERHVPGVTNEFSADGLSRVLVCDEAGEDGLNLNGGKKLVVHYSQPLSFSRIEQRIGRVNRYSAHISAAPVENIVLAPQGDGYSRKWQAILAQAIGIYKESAASLQYVLEEHIEAAWNDVSISGVKSLDNLYELLVGDAGLVVREKQKVIVQEQLNRMDEDIEAANIFSRQVTEADELAEDRKKMMMNWITKALIFEKVRGEFPGTFRFMYHNDDSDRPRTLMDAKTLREKCITGIDHDMSNRTSIVTSLMSSDRVEASHGRKVYPFRFGQPFVDAIYDAMALDSRGICTAVIRQVKSGNLTEMTTFFKIDHLLLSDTEGTSYSDQRKGDEAFPPHKTSHWFKQSGELLMSEVWIAYLNGNTDKDMQVRLQHWKALEEDYSPGFWAQLVDQVVESARINIHSDSVLQGYKSRVIGIKAIIVVPT
jgi:ATP-dependent helicase HepA